MQIVQHGCSGIKKKEHARIAQHRQQCLGNTLTRNKSCSKLHRFGPPTSSQLSGRKHCSRAPVSSCSLRLASTGRRRSTLHGLSASLLPVESTVYTARPDTSGTPAAGLGAVVHSTPASLHPWVWLCAVCALCVLDAGAGSAGDLDGALLTLLGTRLLHAMPCVERLLSLSPLPAIYD